MVTATLRSLRRNDPDQVRWVGFHLSAMTAPQRIWIASRQKFKSQTLFRGATALSLDWF